MEDYKELELLSLRCKQKTVLKAIDDILKTQDISDIERGRLLGLISLLK